MFFFIFAAGGSHRAKQFKDELKKITEKLNELASDFLLLPVQDRLAVGELAENGDEDSDLDESSAENISSVLASVFSDLVVTSVVTEADSTFFTLCEEFWHNICKFCFS